MYRLVSKLQRIVYLNDYTRFLYFSMTDSSQDSRSDLSLAVVIGNYGTDQSYV